MEDKADLAKLSEVRIRAYCERLFASLGEGRDVSDEIKINAALKCLMNAML